VGGFGTAEAGVDGMAAAATAKPTAVVALTKLFMAHLSSRSITEDYHPY